MFLNISKSGSFRLLNTTCNLNASNHIFFVMLRYRCKLHVQVYNSKGREKLQGNYTQASAKYDFLMENFCFLASFWEKGEGLDFGATNFFPCQHHIKFTVQTFLTNSVYIILKCVYERASVMILCFIVFMIYPRPIY